MIEFAAKTPTIPIPFHRLLKVVAVVDRDDARTKTLLQQLETEGYEVELRDRYDFDVSEDAEVGAYIALVDGDRREKARALGQAVRAIGFRTPLWALADSHAISNVAALGMTGEVEGFIYLGQQTPAFYAKQVVASIVDYGMSLLPPFFGGLMAYDAEANIAFDCPGHQGGQFYRKSPSGQLFFKHFGEKVFRNDLCNADVDLGDLLIHEGAAATAQRHAAHVFGADKTYFVLNGTSTSNKVVDKVGKLCEYMLWDEAWIGYNAFHPLFEDHSPMRLGKLGPEMPGLFSTQRWDDKAKPMLDYFFAFEESFNRFPGFNYEVQGVYQERVEGRIKFHTYVVRP